ncbi:TonB-dependent receptor plug domain-containing protein [Janthinobacterium lividum]|uniref:TonB-dependent receptor n=1 Tax=Janthinobacterium lividum TaxID=29581 RepID=A0ABU0XZW3_9BURK|nr:TonB-dependent receptor [Janthinobacterium lividum]MDQ4628435.1 TonB-dependent receptor [Janthinobacterium lividum]MDQ4676128.1 TonB-dependent receptor [Janthinobacterium lividum]MDQ4687393.1 TonB-dependent receptor [Janthinobacterium lividum]
MLKQVLAGAVMLALAHMAQTARAQQMAGNDGVDAAAPFVLGTVTVIGQREQAGQLEQQVGSQVSRAEMRRFNRDNVGDALNLMSGVSLSTNARNEKTVAIRGFDSRQVPLYIDGIPVYVPYDGYVDFNRFTTSDLAAIQVAKGFSSVAYGANTLGGAINLVSRKPSARMEGDTSIGFGSGSERQVSANVGTNQGLWYLQAGVSYIDSDGFPLSSDFRPTATEDGGTRNNAYRKDHKLSFKVGYTPVGGDEYALSYYKQHGEKGQPPSTNPVGARYWQWPYWNKESVYFVSQTRLGDAERLKLRLYHDSYDNEITSYTNGSYAALKTSGQGSVSGGRSIYNDRTNGGAVELESFRRAAHSLRFVASYKADEHQELDAKGVRTTWYKDALWTLGAEDSIALNAATELSLGVSRNALRPDTVYSAGNAYTLPENQSATDLQAGLFRKVGLDARVYATVARKSRLPTLKDRYSQRLGTYIENPNLRAEEALNYEVGYQASVRGLALDAALFYSDVKDKIQSVANVAGVRAQMRNAGRAHISGAELGLRGSAGAWLDFGGNYTYTEMKNVSDRAIRLTDVPRHKLTAHAVLHAARQVDVVAIAEANSGRWVSNTLELGGFATVNLKAVYRPLPALTLEAGVSNLADRNYALADGFPSAGRTWLANAQYQF